MEKLSRLLSSGLSAARSLAVAVLFVVAAAVSAQTVSISPKTGNVISVLSYEDESHLDKFGGVWVHNQLPMTLVTSDKSDLMKSGMMKEHANNMAVVDDKLVFASGTSVTNHMSLSLPKGYRFTSYKLVMDYDDEGTQASTFREMDGSFSTSYASATVSNRDKGKSCSVPRFRIATWATFFISVRITRKEWPA